MTDLETMLSCATNPSMGQYNSNMIAQIVRAVDSNPNGVHIALRLLSHKMQSPQEEESLISLSLLGALAQQCGSLFHAELGKFKFLNEIVKMLSPKYSGNSTSKAVKDKCIQLLYKWQRDLGLREPKFVEAYKMLREQGIILADPVSVTDTIPTKPSGPNIFSKNAGTSERLARLLRSRNPTDLRAANELIKSMVKEDEIRLERATQRSLQMDVLRNNACLLEDLVTAFSVGGSSESELEVMQEVAQTIRDTCFVDLPLADTDAQVLPTYVGICGRAQAALRMYEQTVLRGGRSNLQATSQPQQRSNAIDQQDDTDLLMHDLLSLHLPGQASVSGAPLVETQPPTTEHNKLADLSDLEAVFCATSVNQSTCVFPPKPSTQSLVPDSSISPKSSQDLLSSLFDCEHVSTVPNSVQTITTAGGHLARCPAKPVVKNGDRESQSTSQDALRELDNLSWEMFGLHRPFKPETSETPDGCTVPESSDVGTTTVPENCTAESPTKSPLFDLYQVELKLSDIQPHPTRTQPLVIYPSPVSPAETAAASLQLALHFAANKPADGVFVLVAVLTSKHPSPVADVLLRFACDKSCRLRHLIPSGTSLPAYSPFLPPSAISEIILLACPKNQPTCQLKFQLSCTIDEENVLEAGQANDVPLA